MSENKSKRKDIIKNIAIVFLTVLLILTFFSQTIMNYSLPQVATAYVANDTISTSIRGTGTVEAADPYSVIIGDDKAETATTHKITKIAVQEGDEVEKGDILFYLDEKSNSAIEAAQKAYEEAQAAYETALLSEGVNASVIAQANSSFDAEQYSKQLIEAQKEVDARQKDVDDIQKVIDAFELQISITGSENQNTGVVNAQKAVNEAQKMLAEAPDKLNKALEALAAAQGEQQSAAGKLDVANRAYEAAVAEGKTEEELNVLAGEVTKAQTELIQAQSKTEEAQKKAEEAQKSADDAPAALEKAQKALDSAKLDQQNSLLNLNQQLATYQLNKKNAENLLAEKKLILDTLTGNKGAIISLKDAKEALEEAKKALAEAKKEQVDSAIPADLAGTITAINFKSGESVETGKEVMVIRPAGQGYTLSVPVTLEQSRKVHVGDGASLVNNWWYEEVKIVLRSIRPDPSDPARKRLLVFDVEGDMTEGQNLTVSIGERSTPYEMVVPNSSVREDNNGKFILIVESKSSPLGNRYVATRVDVQVIASDDTKSAITGALNGWEYVITTSTHPINAGQLVRLSENG